MKNLTINLLNSIHISKCEGKYIIHRNEIDSIIIIPIIYYSRNGGRINDKGICEVYLSLNGGNVNTFLKNIETLEELIELYDNLGGCAKVSENLRKYL